MVGIRLFPLGARPIFRGELLVSGRAFVFKKKMATFHCRVGVLVKGKHLWKEKTPGNKNLNLNHVENLTCFTLDKTFKNLQIVHLHGCRFGFDSKAKPWKSVGTNLQP